MNAQERLQLVLEELEMSTSALAKYIGLPRPDRLYHVQRGRNNISDDLAHKIVAKLPNLSYDWLRFGLGKMWID
jgi:plasmid maintenance system antidote protein VapI